MVFKVIGSLEEIQQNAAEGLKAIAEEDFQTFFQQWQDR
jgi:hypothetical protein